MDYGILQKQWNVRSSLHSIIVTLTDFLHDSWRFNNPMPLSQWSRHFVRTCAECHFAVMLQSLSVGIKTARSALAECVWYSLASILRCSVFISSFSSIDRGPHYFCIAMFEPTGSSSTPIAERQTRMYPSALSVTLNSFSPIKAIVTVRQN